MSAPQPPPRGPVHPETGRRPPLLPRPESSYGSATERSAVKNFRVLSNAAYAARLERGWSLRELAQRAGLSVSAVNAFENGSSWPRLHTLTSVFAALDLEAHVDGNTDLPAALADQMRARRWSRTATSYAAGVRPNTLIELLETPSPSTATLLRVAAALRCRIEVRSARRSENA